MRFAEALAAQPKVSKGPDCTVCVVMQSLDDDERADVEQAFASTLATTTIHRALRLAGHDVSLSPVARHRKGECSGLRR